MSKKNRNNSSNKNKNNKSFVDEKNKLDKLDKHSDDSKDLKIDNKKESDLEKDKAIENIIANEIKEKEIKKKERKDKPKEEIHKNNNSLKKENKIYKHSFVHSLLIISLILSLVYFIISLFYSSSNSFSTLINCLLLIIFTLLFVCSSIKTNKKNKNGFGLSSLFLSGFFIFGIITNIGIIKLPENTVIDFTNKSLTEVLKWCNKNNIKLNQNYEYSDIIDEYFIINQNVRAGSRLKNIKNITVSISEGPNPYKEIIIPSMLSWTDKQVLDFVNKNHLSNVDIDFVESSKLANTVIEQSQSGKMKRNDNIKLIFSFGEGESSSEFKMIDLTNKSKFETILYLKMHKLNYEFVEEFSDEILPGYVISQSIAKDELISSDSSTITVTVSKGPKIKIPNLRKMTSIEVSDWVIDNKLKLEITSKYDDEVPVNNILSANYDEGEFVSEGTIIKIVISNGKLKMEEFDDYNKFKEWASTYNINYEEKHQFDDNVAAGNIISFSHKVGDIIKNNDIVVITISDGKAVSVPNLKGLSKKQAINKLDQVGLRYNFVYSYSDVQNGDVIRQSISANSKVSANTTITVTISKGPKPYTPPKPNPKPNPPEPSKPTCVEKTYVVGRDLNNVFSSGGSYESVESQLYSFFSSHYPGVIIKVLPAYETGMAPGSYVKGIGPGTSIKSCNSTPYNIWIAK